MQTTYLLQHLHLLPQGEEDVKIIGIYASRDAALAAIERLKDQPGFADFSALISLADLSSDGAHEGFYIDEYNLDEDHWTEGYVTH
jgi:hypothetical protein